ncbi:hypothetical protein F5884DRAFT_667530 [Xylogone sp. PMI_703]|nr:hypothetical protein F5884DRAFT_667530 [Xylogone sp. PMI_703]
MSPPHLQLTSSTFDSADMILSSHNSPRLSLRKAGAYNPNDRGPLSSTSSRFNFNHLVFSPPPSPSLPALIPRHGRPAPIRTPRRIVRGCIWLFGVVVILYFGLRRVQLDHPVRSIGWANNADKQYEMIGDADLPDFPTPVVVNDLRGRAKWTISIPAGHSFPLKPAQYVEMCQQSMEVAHHVEDLHAHKHKTHAAHYSYYHVDPNFLDVDEAEEHGLLPGGKAKQQHTMVGENTAGSLEAQVCERSMTFVLESHDAGLGNSLMMLWTAYGLAQKENRSFFVDDTNWAYGKYSSYFQPPPLPGCRPPPRHQILPCPHHARHLVVSAATVQSTFGGMFNEEFEDARKMEVFRLKPIFEFARAGYDALFNLTLEDASYVNDRIKDLKSKASTENGRGLIVGVHVRHGDRHPLEFQYRDSYVPLDRYSDKAEELIDQSTNDSVLKEHSIIVLASDDPDVYDSEEFGSAHRAQEQIRLASKSIISSEETAPRSPDAIHPFSEETVGWEGGFFAGMFWSLGRPSTPGTANAVQGELYRDAAPTEESLKLREFVGRAYLMDLAVLGHVSDSVICTVSSTGCRLLGVMMGWEKAIVEAKKNNGKGWWNVDGDFEWRGINW